MCDAIGDGACKLIEQAVEAELAALIGGLFHGEARRRPREVGPARAPAGTRFFDRSDPVPVPVLRVRDRGAREDKITFTPSVLPRYLRKAKSVEELIPGLCLKRVSDGDLQHALAALLGPNAKGSSAKTITRLKAGWWKDYEAWQRRNLGTRRFLYIWADRADFKPGIPEQNNGFWADEFTRKELWP